MYLCVRVGGWVARGVMAHATHAALPHATLLGSATFRSILPLSTATSYAADVSVGVAGECRLQKGGRGGAPPTYQPPWEAKENH